MGYSRIGDFCEVARDPPMLRLARDADRYYCYLQFPKGLASHLEIYRAMALGCKFEVSSEIVEFAGGRMKVQFNRGQIQCPSNIAC